MKAKVCSFIALIVIFAISLSSCTMQTRPQSGVYYCKYLKCGLDFDRLGNYNNWVFIDTNGEPTYVESIFGPGNSLEIPGICWGKIYYKNGILSMITNDRKELAFQRRYSSNDFKNTSCKSFALSVFPEDDFSYSCDGYSYSFSDNESFLEAELPETEYKKFLSEINTNKECVYFEEGTLFQYDGFINRKSKNSFLSKSLFGYFFKEEYMQFDEMAYVLLPRGTNKIVLVYCNGSNQYNTIVPNEYWPIREIG